MKTQRHFVMTCLVAVALLGLSAQAPAAMFTNGGFESGATGWTLVGSTNTQTNVDRSYEGSGSLVFNGGNTTPNAVVSQSFDTVVGESYYLNFHMAQHGTSSSGHSILDIDIFDGAGFGGTNLLTDQAEVFTGVPFNSQAGTVDGLTPFYERFTFSFTAQSTTSTLRFTDASTNLGSGFDPYVDSIAFTLVPTPAALPAGLTLIAAMLLRRRR